MSEFSTSLFKSFSDLTKFFQIAVTRLLEESVHSDRAVLDLTPLYTCGRPMEMDLDW